MELQQEDLRASHSPAQTLDPDTFIEDLDAEDLQERVAFTGEFSLRINRRLSD